MQTAEGEGGKVLDTTATASMPEKTCSEAGADLLRIVRINEGIKSVVAVAFKINIMALNAIFLAKRAGNAALGFAVLSNELRAFSGDLRESMEALRRLVHEAVGRVSVLLQDMRRSALLDDAVGRVEGRPELVEVIRKRQELTRQRTLEVAALRRELKLALDSSFQLADLGGVLAKSAKIEAAYGQGFAQSLSQVSGEFDGVIEEIRNSLDALRKSEFFRGGRA